MSFEIPGVRFILCLRCFVAALWIVLVNAVPQFGILSAYGQYEDSDAGYLDSAFVTNRARLRFDAGWDLNRPDRAEFFYASWANLADHQHAIKDTNQVVSAVNDRGPLRIPESVNFQEISTYFEWACYDRLSVFAELPIRWVQFLGDAEDPNAFETPEFRVAYDAAATKAQGVSDTQFGFKYAVLKDPGAALTFQLRIFTPTGDSRSGLGTGHVSVEPALLMQTSLNDNLSLMGQAKLWTPINGGANAGNIAIYGAGLGYTPHQANALRITLLAEFVGWTVLDGFETLSSPDSLPVVPNTARLAVDPFVTDANGNHQTEVPPGSGGRPAPVSHGVQIANGKTIINAKLGFRTHFTPQDSVYVGWGRALSGDRWYQDFARIEYRRLF